MTKLNRKINKGIALIMAFLISVGFIVPISAEDSYAASNEIKITIAFDHTVTYGSGAGGYTNLKTTTINDGLEAKRPVLCMQPAEATPPDGTYTISKVLEDDQGTGKWNAIRNILYYTPGYPGYKEVKDSWFEGYTRDEAIGVMHLAVSYVRAGRPDQLNCWQGTTTATIPSRIWDKAKAIGDKLWTTDDNVPQGFKVLYVKVGDYQDMVCGYMNLGNLQITKEFLNSDVTKDNDCYSKDGITFTVYNEDNEEVGKFITDKSGSITPSELEVDEGTYTVIETHNKNGYTGNGDSRIVDVKAGSTAVASFTDIPVTDPVGIILRKMDLEIGQEFPQGAATLANAEYTVRYFDGQYSTVAETEASGNPTRTWVYKTDEKGRINFDKEQYKVSGDALYHTTTGKVTFPLGTVLIQETKAPTGYLIDTSVYLRNITDPDSGKAMDVTTYNAPISTDQVKRGDFYFIKSSEGKERMAGIPFKVTSKTTGESHMVITDENGYVNTSSSWNPHSQNTNKGENATDGVWFGTDSNGNIAAVDDKLCALPYDTYTIEEQHCEANKKYELVNLEVVISRDCVEVNLGTIDDPLMEEPEISTNAIDSETKNHISLADNEVTIVDTISYKNFIVGKTYKIQGVLMDQKTSKPIEVDGKVITAETEFKCQSKEGSVEVKFNFDGTSLAGTDVVVFEKALDVSTGEVIATHEDINDDNQKVSIPQIGTKATGENGKTNIIKPEKNQIIIDTVSYNNVIIGEKYELVTWLVKDGNLIEGTEVRNNFTANQEAGEVKVELNFDASDYAGENVTVFEELYLNGKLIGQHKDKDDKNQTISVSKPNTPETPKKPEVPVSPSNKDIPTTGDTSNLKLYAALAAIAALLGTGVYGFKKKKIAMEIAKKVIEEEKE